MKNIIFIVLLSLFLLFVWFLMVNKIEASSTLLFKSSFGEGVYLEKPNREKSEVWWQTIKGSDNNQFSWPINLNGNTGKFQMIFNDDNISHYAKNSLIKTIDNKGNSIHAVHQKIKHKEHGWSQDPYVIYTKDKEVKELYIRYSLKFPKNLADLLGGDGWLAFCEYKTKSDNRLAFYIYCDKRDKHLYWYVHGDNVVKDDRPYEEYWFRENNKVKVPVGEWMDVELYWYRSSTDDGRVWWSVNGKLIVDYHGPTKIKESIHEIMLFTNYANKPIEQWVTNIEVWDGFPYKKGQSLYKKEQY